ncbi:MAG: hypothetical protein M1835_006528 [Candelina submexicana]|nr:MAG: hypothetical protein M1835_006528 [Candelina submexicana]
MTTIPSDTSLAELQSDIVFTQTCLHSLEGNTSEDARLRVNLEVTLADLKTRLEHRRELEANTNVIGAHSRIGNATQMGQTSSQQHGPADDGSSHGVYDSYATHGAESFGGTPDVGPWDDAWTFCSLQDSNIPNSAIGQPREALMLGRTSSTDTSPGASSVLSSPSLPDLPSGKRARESFAEAYPSSGGHQRKCRRTTPSPATTSPTTPSSLDSWDIPKDVLEVAKASTGDVSTRKLRHMYKEVEERAWLVRKDAEYARQLLQEEMPNPQQVPLQPSVSLNESHASPYCQAGPLTAPPVKTEISFGGFDDSTFQAQATLSSAPSNDETSPFSSVAQLPMQLPTRPYIDLGSDDDLLEIQPEAFQDNGRLHRQQHLKSSELSGPYAAVSENKPMQDIDDILAQYSNVQSIQNPWATSTTGSGLGNGYANTSPFASNVSAASTSMPVSNPMQGRGQVALGRGQSFKDTANAWYNRIVGASPLQSTIASPFEVSQNTWNPTTGLALPVPSQGFDSGLSGSSNPQTGLNQFGLPQPRSLQSIVQDSQFNVDGIEGHELYQNYRNRYDYIANDPTKTRDELTSLLENIRPDEELPPENREGTPERMTYPLMEHQKLGLTWLKNMEEGSNKGGILADDMGLGKTIQALSLIVSRPSPDPRRKTTLIIGPVALMKQWEREIQTKVRGGRHALTVYTLHGSKKGTWNVLKNFDVVLTTYGTLASEFNRREAWEMKKKGDPDLRPGPADRLSLLADECKWYRVIIDEAQFIKNKGTKAARGACCLQSITRICMTGTPMMNNIGELFSLIEFLRIKPYNAIEKFNLDFTRPLKGTSQAGKDQAMRKLQALLKAILLRRTKKSKIDGAPILNLPERTTEIRHAIFDEDEQAFYTALETQTQLQFNKYLKAGTVGKHYSNVLVLLLRLRQACCHPHLIRDFGVAANTDISVSDMLALAKELAPDVIDRIKLQEAFECPICYDGVPNPAIFIPCGHDTCSECFSKISDPAVALARGDERLVDVKCPTCRSKITPSKIIDYDAFKKVHMPEAILDSDKATAEDEEVASETESEDDEADDDLDGFVVPDDKEDDETDSEVEGTYGKGSNPFTKSASRAESPKNKKDIKGKGKAKQSKTPPKSLAQLKKEGMRNVKARRRYMRRLKRDWISSAKLKKCIEILGQIQMRQEGEKTIIFSQFTSLLDLLEVPIDEQGWGYKRYDGSMSAVQRNQAVVEFTDRPDIKVMLVSLKAGNAGLNLVAASQVIILDPFWNPYVEEQAIDRSHRIGQLRPVQVHRILIQDTVEDRIIALQDKKRTLIEGALDETASQNISRLGTRELAYLFGVGNQA